MRRHTILEALRASKGEYISGERLSQTLGITRGKGGKAAQSRGPLRFPAEINYGYCSTTVGKVKKR